MMKGLKELRNKLKEKKGFTLVEIVVVLVIIAILATLMMGALNGYINKAKEKEGVSNARALALAGQTVASEFYAANATLTEGEHTITSAADAATFEGKVYELCGITKTKFDAGEAKVVVDKNYKVTSAIWTGDGLKTTFDVTNSKVTTEKAPEKK